MSLESEVQILKQVPLFALFGDDQLRLLAFSAESRQLRDGTQLYAAGDRADAGFVVAAGTFGITRLVNGRQQTVLRARPGELLAEMALIVETQHTTGAVALGDAGVIQIRRQIFRRVLDEYPDVALRLKDVFAGRLAGTMSGLMQVAERLSG